MDSENLILHFEDNTVTLYKSAKSGEKYNIATFITEEYGDLSTKTFTENLKALVSDNKSDESYIFAVLHESLFYNEIKLMPKLPVFLLNKSIKKELDNLFSVEKMKEYKLKINKSKSVGKSIKVEIKLVPINKIKKIKKLLQKIAVKKFKIIY